MRDPKRGNPIHHPRAVALLAVILAVVVAVCAEPGGGPLAPETPEAVTELNGDAIEGWHVGAVAADEEEEDTTFVCSGPRDCWNECQKHLELERAGRDGHMPGADDVGRENCK